MYLNCFSSRFLACSHPFATTDRCSTSTPQACWFEQIIFSSPQLICAFQQSYVTNVQFSGLVESRSVSRCCVSRPRRMNQAQNLRDYRIGASGRCLQGAACAMRKMGSRSSRVHPRTDAGWYRCDHWQAPRLGAVFAASVGGRYSHRA